MENFIQEDRYKKLFNLRYVVMACIKLHNLCIEHNNPCEPRWWLEVNDLKLFEKLLKRNMDINESNLNRTFQLVMDEPLVN